MSVNELCVRKLRVKELCMQELRVPKLFVRKPASEATQWRAGRDVRQSRGRELTGQCLGAQPLQSQPSAPSATPATQNKGGCECHACHAKHQWMSPKRVTKLHVTKLYVTKWCVTKWCVTKLCVTKMVCDKIVCVCVTGGGGVGGGGREEERTGYRNKNKNPTQKCGERTQSLHVFLLRWAMGLTNWLVTGDLLPSKNPNEIIHGY